MKIRPVGAELFEADRQTDGRTDGTKLLVAFRNFANAPKNENNKQFVVHNRISVIKSKFWNIIIKMNL
jgi:hypothetical protein